MHVKHLSLFLPAMLTGCSAFGPPRAAPDVPALVFIDGQIGESAEIIALTQQRLAPPPVTPSPARPATAARASESVPLPAPLLVSGYSRLSVTGPMPSVPVTQLPTQHRLTVSDWIKKLLPPDWQFMQENAARPRLSTRLASWSANDQWPRSLNRLLQEQHLWGRLDWNTKTLTVTASQTQAMAAAEPAVAPAPAPVKASHAATAAPAPATVLKTPPAVKAAPAQPPKKQPAPDVPRNPFRDAGNTPMAQTTALPGAAPVAVSKPAAPAVTVWRAEKGATLKDTLFAWAATQPCAGQPDGKWTVQWATETNYRIDAPLRFTGDFRHALKEIFTLYQRAAVPLYAGTSSAQCLIKVDDRPVG